MKKVSPQLYPLILAFTLTLILALQPASSISTALLNPEADGYTDEGNPLHEMGSEYLFVANAKPNQTVDARYWYVGEARTYMRFDLSSLPRGTTVTSARLRAYSIIIKEPHRIGVYYSSDSKWEETALDWRRPPRWEPSLLSIVTVERIAKWYEWDVAEAVQRGLASPDRKVTLVLISEDEHDTNMWIAFYSKDQELEVTKERIPQLEVSYEIGEVEGPLPLEYAFVTIGVIVVVGALAAFFLLKRRGKGEEKGSEGSKVPRLLSSHHDGQLLLQNSIP